MMRVAAVCADSDEPAGWLHGPAKLSFLSTTADPPPSARRKATEYTPDEREFIDSWTTSHIAPPKRPRTPTQLQQRTGANELVLTTNVHDHADRLHSYQLAHATALLITLRDQESCAPRSREYISKAGLTPNEPAHVTLLTLVGDLPCRKREDSECSLQRRTNLIAREARRWPSFGLLIRSGT